MDTVETFRKIGIPRNPIEHRPLGTTSIAVWGYDGVGYFEIGRVKSENNIMTIIFEKDHEMTREEMRNLFGAFSGEVVAETKEGKIKKFMVTSWGYQ